MLTFTTGVKDKQVLVRLMIKDVVGVSVVFCVESVKSFTIFSEPVTKKAAITM